jgi:hypothetical protein
MPASKYDSSKTRVAPVFDALARSGQEWVLPFLQLAKHPEHIHHISPSCSMKFLSGRWGNNEIGLRPPVSLLSWMLRHPGQMIQRDTEDPQRRNLLAGDHKAVALALDALRNSRADRAWFIFEGPTYPDAYIETEGALIVIEGERTESGPTTSTTWLEGRHQMWRHIDAAWERRGNRQVYGVFVVEEDPVTHDVPVNWVIAAENALSQEVLEVSFPHRSGAEREGIVRCFLGVITWQKILSQFALPSSILVTNNPGLRSEESSSFQK